MPPVLEIRNLVKHYPKVRAVDGVSFDIAEGCCFGLLGPNGAGKTTTIEILEGIHAADSGDVRYRGAAIDAQYRQRIGIQFQQTALPDYLTVREVLSLFGSFYRNPAERDQLIGRCALGEFLDRTASRLSGGQKQRLLLALALINNPDLLFLDEPTTGLDPQARRNFWDLIRSLKAEGTTILLTTHYMEEAHLLCDEIAIMDCGRIIAQGAPNQLLHEHFEGVWIRVPKNGLDRRYLDSPAIEGEVTELDDAFEIRTRRAKQTLTQLAQAADHLAGLQVRSPTLEDLFLKLTGKELRS